MALELSKILYAFLGFMFIFVGFQVVYGDFITTYNIPDTSNSSTYNYIRETGNITQDMSNSVFVGQSSSTNAIDLLLSGSYSALRLGFNIIPMTQDIIYDVTSRIGVDSGTVNWAIAIIFTFILLAVTFALINAVFKTGGGI